MFVQRDYRSLVCCHRLFTTVSRLGLVAAIPGLQQKISLSFGKKPSAGAGTATPKVWSISLADEAEAMDQDELLSDADLKPVQQLYSLMICAAIPSAPQ